MGWPGGERPAGGRPTTGRAREEGLVRESQPPAAPPRRPRGQECRRREATVPRTAHEVSGWRDWRRRCGQARWSSPHCQPCHPLLALVYPIVSAQSEFGDSAYEIGARGGAAAAATGNSGRRGGDDAGAAAQATAVARGARGGSLCRHRQCWLPRLFVGGRTWDASPESWEKKVAATLRGAKISNTRRGGKGKRNAGRCAAGQGGGR